MEVELRIPAAEQLLKVVASGVGAIAGPMLERWRARTTADALRIEAQAKADSIGLIAAAQAEALGSLSTSQTSTRVELDIRDEIHSRLTFQEKKRQQNIETVVRHAADYLGDKEVDDNEIDHDWTATFFTDVQDVSSEKMQQIWARILAGEVDRPGSTSMRTLATLKTISQRDSELFQKATQFVLAKFVLNDDAITRRVLNFPSYGEFMRLSHHGLFQLGTALHMNFRDQNEYLFLEEDVVFRIFRDGGKTFNLDIPSHILSPSGEEIYDIVKQRKSDEYIRGLAQFLSKKYRAKLAYCRTTSPEGKPLSHAQLVVVDTSTPSSAG